MSTIAKKIQAGAAMLAILLSVTMPMECVWASGNQNLIIASAEGNMSEGETDATADDNITITLEEALKQKGELENRYSQLEEKYQREKAFSRSVIYVMIFVIATLIVIIINLIVFNRNKEDDEFEENFKEKKTGKKESVRKESTKKELVKKEPVKEESARDESIETEILEKEVRKEQPAPKAEKSFTKKTEKKSAKVEKTSAKVEKTSTKVEVGNKFEVFDFNDED